MEESSGQWVFRADKDQVKGPYTTEELRAMIVSGNFSGTEEICQYPQGEWQVLTKQPEFYDALLESLENPIEAQKKKDQKQDAETVIKPGGPPVKKPAEIPKFDLKEFVDNEIKAEQDLKARMEGDKKKKDKEPQSSTAVTTLAPSDTSVQKPNPEELQMPVLAPLERGITKKANVYNGNILKDRDK
jgi:hypothetical protein